MQRVYLDYNASTPCDKKVGEVMNKVWGDFGNPHSNHIFGLEKLAQIEDCKECLSRIYNCLPEDVIFTSGATEANNLAIFSGIKLALKENSEANVILTSYLEHKSVLEPLKVIAKKLDLTIIYIDIDKNGILDLVDLRQKLSENHVLWASFCMTNGEIGTNQPIQQLAKICSENGIVIHVDASQAGYCDIDFDELDIDYLTISGHKIYGPTGIGLLISKHLQNSEFEPMIYGGGQQNGLRSGTLPTPLIVGLTKAVEILQEVKESETQQLAELKSYLLRQLQAKFEVKVQGSLINRHPGNLHVSIQGIDSLQLLNNLQPHIAFSLGSACNGLNRDYPSLMKEIGVDKDEFESSFRITVGRMTTKEEIDFAVQKITDFVEFQKKNASV